MYNFFATISRMKYIDRWALMRNSRDETLSEHSIETAFIAHALCIIGNKRYGRDLDPNEAAVIAMYHDATEIITGDMPTPVKYLSKEIRDTYALIEENAIDNLICQLPEDLKEEYTGLLKGCTDELTHTFVKAADKLSAYIKCIEEEKSGNAEFKTAKDSIYETILDKYSGYPEVIDFLKEFIPAYGHTLDELRKNPN